MIPFTEIIPEGWRELTDAEVATKEDFFAFDESPDYGRGWTNCVNAIGLSYSEAKQKYLGIKIIRQLPETTTF